MNWDEPGQCLPTGVPVCVWKNVISTALTEGVHEQCQNSQSVFFNLCKICSAVACLSGMCRLQWVWMMRGCFHHSSIRGLFLWPAVRGYTDFGPFHSKCTQSVFFSWTDRRGTLFKSWQKPWLSLYCKISHLIQTSYWAGSDQNIMTLQGQNQWPKRRVILPSRGHWLMLLQSSSIWTVAWEQLVFQIDYNQIKVSIVPKGL